MPVVPHLESVAAIADQARTPELFPYALRDFLDGFYESPKAIKLMKEPSLLGEIMKDEGYADAYLAAMTEHLAAKYKFDIPEWCRNPERSLKMPKFAFRTPEGQMFLLVESPTAFRVRNIFISADGLSRV